MVECVEKCVEGTDTHCSCGRMWGCLDTLARKIQHQNSRAHYKRVLELERKKLAAAEERMANMHKHQDKIEVALAEAEEDRDNALGGLRVVSKMVEAVRELPLVLADYGREKGKLFVSYDDLKEIIGDKKEAKKK